MFCNSGAHEGQPGARARLAGLPGAHPWGCQDAFSPPVHRNNGLTYNSRHPEVDETARASCPQLWFPRWFPWEGCPRTDQEPGEIAAGGRQGWPLSDQTS